MPEIRRTLVHTDGREEVFRPYVNDQGCFVLATQLTDDPIHHASNQILVETETELLEKLRSGRFHLRMTANGKSPANLISPESIEIVE